jgi:hypothetical protein
LSQAGFSGQNAQTGTAYSVSGTLTSSTIATYTYQGTLSLATQYWWRAYAIDPANGSGWSVASPIRSFYTESPPGVPTLLSPPAGGIGINNTGPFMLAATDPDSDTLKYKIDICTTSNCSSILQTIDQTSSQSGWTDQNAANGTAYSSSASLLANSQTAVFVLPVGTLSPATQYWWRAYSIDPAGTNTWSSASGIQTFTTGTSVVTIGGGVTLSGGVHIGN